MGTVESREVHRAVVQETVELDPTHMRHRLFTWALRLSNSAHVIVPAMAAFVLGMFTNAITDPVIHNAWDVVRRIYDVGSRPIAWTAIAATIAIVLLPMGRYAFSRVARTDDFAIRLAALYQHYIEAEFRQFARGRIAWGSSIVLQSCPSLATGWRLADISISRQPTTFSFLSADQEHLFEQFLSDQQFERKDLEPRKFRLANDPIAFIDAPSLNLDVEETSYAQARFYSHSQSRLEHIRRPTIHRALEGTFEFPHSFTLHATIATNDDYVLLTRRSLKVGYFPGTWSCSIEEQLSPDDFPPGGEPSAVMSHWAIRTLREELGVHNEGPGSERPRFRPDNIRISCAFLEGNILACGLAGLITLDIDRDTLDAIIDKHPRDEYEFVEWHFLRWNNLAEELIWPTFSYHPTSGLRMFMAGVMKFGAREFGLRLDREYRRRHRQQH